MFLFNTTTKENRESPLWPYYSVLASDLIVPLVIVILAHISHILHQSLSPFLELCHTISMDLALTWTIFSDHFWVPYHYTYTLILPLFTARDRLPSPCTLPMFHVSFYYYSCTYVSCCHHYQIEQRVPPSTILQCIDLRSHCAPCRHCSCLCFSYIAPIAVTFFGTSSHYLYRPCAYLNNIFWPFLGPLSLYLHTHSPPFHCKRWVTLTSHYSLILWCL